MKSGVQLSVLFILIAVNGCSTYSCRDAENDFSILKACDMVVLHNKSSARTIDISGYNPQTHASEDYVDTNGLYVYIYPSITPGDSALKTRNDNCYLIKKGKFNIKFSIDCKEGGQSIGKMRIDTVAK